MILFVMASFWLLPGNTIHANCVTYLHYIFMYSDKALWTPFCCIYFKSFLYMLIFMYISSALNASPYVAFLFVTIILKFIKEWILTVKAWSYSFHLYKTLLNSKFSFLVDDSSNCCWGCQARSKDIKSFNWTWKCGTIPQCIWGWLLRVYSDGVSFFVGALYFMPVLLSFSLICWICLINHRVNFFIVVPTRLCEGGELLDRILSK